ncbi:MBL fold metallo-hydrolase [Snodgrassella alvi]|uniref:MBL fold metallo-hydrolase n=1 Tax=Snodgrassella alvi TaxID=1196083 RepID=UPI000C1E4B32|nr:MBL fold metallo-hydrolase [Snodgrassella alvi]PIT41669.1 MBL fold metallo-hydrolase [Snodgrassella alvi]
MLFKRKNPYYNPKKPHHTPYGFCNLEPTTIKQLDVYRWSLERHIHHLPKPPQQGYAHFAREWTQSPDFTLSGNRLWWISHATLLIRLNQCMIITDPVFSQRVSPVSFAGPKRRTQPAASIAELPHIDVIAISHNHYDHLDTASIRKLAARFPNINAVVPLGLKRKLHQLGINNVTELDWWEQTNINNIRFHAVPAHHWSQRSLLDRNHTLWCGWMMQTPEGSNTYFSGDTGFSEIMFRQIAEHFTSTDMAAIQIGAYAPRWFMHNQHIDPEQAVAIFNILRCRQAIGMHWGAFELADEPLDEPPQLLAAARVRHGLLPECFESIKMGDSRPITSS